MERSAPPVLDAHLDWSQSGPPESGLVENVRELCWSAKKTIKGNYCRMSAYGCLVDPHWM
jgi:hypothetical protein